MKEGVGRALRRAIGRDDVLSRIEPREGGVSVLMNERRREVFQYLVENPLTHLRELARATGIPVSTADWHLKILQNSGIVSAFEDRNKRFFYPSDWIDDDDVLCLSRLRDQISKDIFQLVKRSAELSQTEIARKLGEYQQLVQPHIADLEECGVLRYKQEGRRKLYSMGAKVANLEKKYAIRSKIYLEKVIEMLRNDGLNPKVQSKSKVLMRIKADDGQKTFFLKIRANPVKAVLKQ